MSPSEAMKSSAPLTPLKGTPLRQASHLRLYLKPRSEKRRRVPIKKGTGSADNEMLAETRWGYASTT